MAEKPILNIDLGGISKPATVLIEKISAAVGTFFQPFQVVRLAKAEAEAELIRQESRIQVSDLEKRVAYRWLKEEAKKQANIEAITRQALPLLEDESKPENVEDDWIAHFFSEARIISNEEMQRLWSEVLAAEGNEPGSFSKRTVNLLADLDKFDAELFTRFCGFGWNIEGFELAKLKGRSITEKRPHLVPLIYGNSLGDYYAEIYTAHGVDYAALDHLSSLGLIRFNPEFGYWWYGISQQTRAFYFGKQVQLEFSKPNYPSRKPTEYGINAGHALLSRAGQELCRICHPEPVEGFFEFVQARWKKEGLTD